MQKRFKYFPLVFFLLFQIMLSHLYSQDNSFRVFLNGIGGGRSTVSFSDPDGFQTNDYFLNISFQIEAIDPKISDDNLLATYRIESQTGRIEAHGKISDNIVGNFEYNQSFEYQTIQSGKLIYSITKNEIEYIEFSLSHAFWQKNYPAKVVFKNDEVEVLYYFESPFTSHHLIVPATVSGKGIFLEIIESAETDIIKYVGYKYIENFLNTGFPKTSLRYFSVFYDRQKKFAFINVFGSNFKSDFKNEIYLFDENKKQIGHMYYEYDYQLNKDHVRNAILILHNDADINQPGGAIFPYNNDDKRNFEGWNYYSIGEYPVSMLIPPLNKFPEKYDRSPLLLLHGLSGKYEYAKWKYFYIPPSSKSGELAKPGGEDISYWFTTPKILNRNSNWNWDTWQMYYPNNDGAATVSECLKYDLSHLRLLYQRKINLVTHSYGGNITWQYLTNYSQDAKNVLNKVLFMAPPIHGSFAANRAYENITLTGTLTELFDDPNPKGLCYRDASLGSDIIRNYWDKSFPSLDDDSDIYDDYFVILGATNKYYITERIHEEAKNHNDGLVAISSASLLDKKIGFASISGNHDDAIHAQSNHGEEINIGNPYLIPSIINDYFINKYDDFLNKIKNYSLINAILKHDKIVIKPAEMTLSNLTTPTGENYQMSLLNFELINRPTDFKFPDGFYAYYDNVNRILKIQEDYDFIMPGYKLIGKFWKNLFTNRYYFIKCSRLTFNPGKLDHGCAINLIEGINTIYFKHPDHNITIESSIDIGYCQSYFLSIDLKNLQVYLLNSNGQSRIKEERISAQSDFKGTSNNPLEFYVDDQTTLTTFLLSTSEPGDSSFIGHLFQPDGEEYNTSWERDIPCGVFNIKIADPTPGIWHLLPESTSSVSDTINFFAQSLYQSNIILYDSNPGTADIEDINQINANLVLPDKIMLSEIIMKAVVTSPEGFNIEYDFSTNKVATDSGFVYSFPLNQDIAGIYAFSIECIGTYNNYKFERFFSSQIEVVDRKPIFYIPDVNLDGLNLFREINLRDQVLCRECNPDDFVFSYNILKNNDVSVYIDSLSVAYITSSLRDTASSVVEFVLKTNDQIICRDTISVTKNLPDLYLHNFLVHDTLLNAGKIIPISFDITNQSTSYTNNSAKAGLVLSMDKKYDKTDQLLTTFPIPVLSPDDTSHFSKDIVVPGGISIKYLYIIIIADPESMIYEVNKENNIGWHSINFTPQTTFQKSVRVGGETGELIYSEPNSFSNSTVSYNGYGVIPVSWWENRKIWAYDGSGTLPLWVNYQFKIDNYENLEMVKIQFTALGTISNGAYYSYLYLQVNNDIIFKNNDLLINSPEWKNYYLILPKNAFIEGINNIKVGTSATSQTYVALQGIMVELRYKPDNSTGIDTELKPENADEIVIFPNPVKDILHLKGLTGSVKILVFDLTGKLLLNKEVNDSKVNVSILKTGMYIMKIETTEGTKTVPFMKQ